MKKMKIKRALCALLAAAVLLLGACSTDIPTDTDTTAKPEETETFEQKTYSAAPGSVTKTETVYVNMDNSGGVIKTVVSDWLHTDKGEVAVSDISTLENIVNVKGNTQPVRDGDSLVWHMDSTDLYYSGTTSKKLPVSMKISYYLDNREMKPEELAGKSGHVTIKVEMKNELFKTEKIGKQNVTIYNPVLVVGGFILQESCFSNASLDNGKIIGDGTKEIALMVGLPGINESLGLDELKLTESMDLSFSDTFTLTADAADFQLGNMYFAAIPLSSLGAEINLPETLGELKASLTQLKELESIISAIDPDKLISSLLADSGKVTSLVGLIDDAVGLFDSNRALLELIPKYMTDENMAALSKLFEDLGDSDVGEVMELLQNPVVSAFLKNLPALALDMQQLAPVMNELSTDMQNPEVAKAVEQLPQTMEKLAEIQKAYEENKELVNSLSSLMSEENLGKIDGLLAAAESGEFAAKLEEYGVLSENADALVSRLSAMLNFGNEYRLFTQARENTETKVMFVFQTQSVRAAAEETPQNTTTQTDGFFKKLFS